MRRLEHVKEADGATSGISGLGFLVVEVVVEATRTGVAGGAGGVEGSRASSVGGINIGAVCLRRNIYSSRRFLCLKAELASEDR